MPFCASSQSEKLGSCVTFSASCVITREVLCVICSNAFGMLCATLVSSEEDVHVDSISALPLAPDKRHETKRAMETLIAVSVHL